MARNYIVEIGDEMGKSCKVSITTRGKFSMGEWRTIDKGYLNQNSGTARHINSNGTLGCHLQLVGGSDECGLRLNDWTYMLQLTNSQGTGWLAGSWGLGLGHGRVSWVIVG